MRPILKTNNPVLLSFAKDLLAQDGIDSFVFDENASIMDGSLGILPRRLMVADDDFAHAKQLLDDAVKPSPASPGDATTDQFLGGRIVVRQLSSGFRSGLDAVILAAAIGAKPNEEVLELGSGAGVASLCLAARVAGVSIVGAEINSELVALSNQSANLNGFGDRAVFVCVDVLDLPPDMRRDYAHVFCNPPFHRADGHRSPDALRAEATQDDGTLADWLAIGLKRTTAGGTFTAIIRADRLDEAVSTLPSNGMRIFPLWPRPGQDARRVVVCVTKGSRAPLELSSGLVLHNADGSHTTEADAILRGEKPLALTHPIA